MREPKRRGVRDLREPKRRLEAREEAGVEGFGDGLDALMDGAGLDAPWDPEDMAALGAMLDAMGGGPRDAPGAQDGE